MRSTQLYTKLHRSNKSETPFLFNLPLAGPNPYDPFILFCDAIAFADIGINLVTGYNDESQKVVVLDRRCIVAQYARGGLLWQLAGALPLQLIEIFPDCTRPTNTVFFLPKLLRFGSLVHKWKVGPDCSVRSCVCPALQ